MYYCTVKKSVMVNKATGNNLIEDTAEIKTASKAEDMTDQVEEEVKTNNDKGHENTKSEKEGAAKTEINKPENYKRECAVCKRVFKSRGGFNKHKKTHGIIDGNNTSKIIIMADENMLKGEDNLIPSSSTDYDIEVNDTIEAHEV